MNVLLDNLKKDIDFLMSNYIKEISDKYSLDKKDLLKLWGDIDNSDDCSLIKQSQSSVKKIINNETKCPYVFSKGARKGEECGDKLKIGFFLCSRHKNCKIKDKKSKKQTFISSVKKTPNKSKVIDTNLILRKNKKIDKFWHFETKLVFKSDKERIVIGVYNNVTKEIEKLTTEDICICKEMNFKYKIDEEDDVIAVEVITECLDNSTDLVHNVPIAGAAEDEMSEAIRKNNLKVKDIEEILKEIQTNDVF